MNIQNRSKTIKKLKGIVDFAFDEMKVKKIFAHISIDNIASVKTAEKLGFVKTGEQYYEEFPFFHLS